MVQMQCVVQPTVHPALTIFVQMPTKVCKAENDTNSLFLITHHKQTLDENLDNQNMASFEDLTYE